MLPAVVFALFCAVLRLDGLFDLLLRGKELLIQRIGDPLIVVVLIQPDGVRSIEDLIAWCGPCAAVRRGQRTLLMTVDSPVRVNSTVSASEAFVSPSCAAQ